MTTPANELARSARSLWALALANVRYWLHVAPQVRQELRRWERRARAIPDPVLRAHAQAKLRDEHFNAQVAATLATCAAAPHRARVTRAIVAFQVMYDYLDALGEQPVDDPLRNGRQLFEAFDAALAHTAPKRSDYYRHHFQHDDGGYLDQLASTCRTALEQLPSAATVRDAALATAALCSEAQSLTHAIPLLGTSPLRAWASARSSRTALTWWELAAGAAASSLTVHALITAAASPHATLDEVARIERTYLVLSTLSTLLDSLIDHEHDTATGSHAYLDYYAQNIAAGRRIATLAQRASTDVRHLRHAAHHHITLVGVIGYYLSSPAARTPFAKPATLAVREELRPMLTPVLAIFALWRRVKQTVSQQPSP